MAATAPDLNIPASTNTVDVSIIDTTHTIKGIPSALFFTPTHEGHEVLGAPIYSFLIQHPKLNRTIVFDLGIRKDWWNYSPVMTANVNPEYVELKAPKSVREILDEGGVDTAKIEAVVWSHWHLDHVGSPAEFEKNTNLIVGPGFKEKLLPGYPANPKSPVLESDYADRELVEIDFTKGLKIGHFEAFDYFGDGSFYFLNSPGHAVGHISALARTTASPPSYILMGGDAWHHSGQIRPSQYLPLPDEIEPNPFTTCNSSCPGALFESVLRDGDRTKPFYEATKTGVHLDAAEALRTVEKLQEADVREDILMAAAHDEALLDIVDFFPKGANDFLARGWVRQARWRFLMDFAKAIGYTGEVKGKRDWTKPEKQ